MRAEIERLWRSGLSSDRIGAMLGCSARNVERLVREMALPGHGAAPWTAEEEQMLRALIARNASRSDAADTLGRSIGAVSRKAHTLGLRFRRQEAVTAMPAHMIAAAYRNAGIRYEDEPSEAGRKPLYVRMPRRAAWGSGCGNSSLMCEGA